MRLTSSDLRRVSPSFHSCSTSKPAHVALRETGPTNLLMGFPATGSQASTRPGPVVRFSAAASDAASITSRELLRRPEVACRLRAGARARRWSHRVARSTRSAASGGQERSRSCAGRATSEFARRSPATVGHRRRGQQFMRVWAAWTSTPRGVPPEPRRIAPARNSRFAATRVDLHRVPWLCRHLFTIFRSHHVFVQCAFHAFRLSSESTRTAS